MAFTKQNIEHLQKNPLIKRLIESDNGFFNEYNEFELYDGHIVKDFSEIVTIANYLYGGTENIWIAHSPNADIAIRCPSCGSYKLNKHKTLFICKDCDFSWEEYDIKGIEDIQKTKVLIKNLPKW